MLVPTMSKKNGDKKWTRSNSDYVVGSRRKDQAANVGQTRPPALLQPQELDVA
jgi:hypothetical protein